MNLRLRASLARVALGYLAAACVVSLGIGVVRSLWRFSQRTLPDQYLLHGIAWNAGLALALGLVPWVALLAASAFVRDTRFEKATAVGTGSAILGVCLPFWAVTTSLHYRDRVATWIAPLAGEALYWLPALAVLAALWWGLLARAPTRIVFRRCAAGSAALIASAAGLWLYGAVRSPAAGPALELEPTARRRPPVFLVLVDTLRADHLSVYGYAKPTSPNVDALAADGTVYLRAFAQAPWTRPSCAALLTSRYPPEIGLRGLWSPLLPEIPILPQFMRIEGYATAGIVSSVHLSTQYGFDKGWDVFDLGTTYLNWTGVKHALARLQLVSRSEAYPRYNAEELTDRAIEWIEAQPLTGRPLFMYLHYSDPHAPYRPPPEQDRWHEFASETARAVAVPPDGLPRDGPILPAAERDAMVARYDAEIAFFDQHFGRLIDHLKERDLYRDALVIVTADHGEEFGEHGGWTHGHTLYNELLHVPLVVKYPAWLTPPAERPDSAGSIDVIPTIREVLDASWPESGFRGRSLLAGNDGSEGDARFLYADNENPSLRGVYQGEGKLIQRLDPSGTVLEERYYSLVSDFRERGDGAIPAVISADRLATLRGILASQGDRALPAEDIEPDEESVEELRALGYIE